MAYETYSSKAPSNVTGIDSAAIQYIEHNPFHPEATLVFYPEKYAQFVNPTNDQMSAVLVEDDDFELSRIRTSENNALYLQHQPVFGTSILVSDGEINPALTDYEHGIIYFSVLPAGAFTVQYLSNPDKYYGEFLQTIQDVLHGIMFLLGAGQTLNEGIKNAEIFCASMPTALRAKLPHAIHVAALGKDIELRSSTDPSAPGGIRHTVTIGNGEDTLVVDTKFAIFKRSTSGANRLVTRIGDETQDFLSIGGDMDVTGEVIVGVRGTSLNPNLSPSSVQSFETTGTPYTGESLQAAFHGDVVVHGDLYVLGTTYNLNITREIQVNVFEESLEVGTDAVIQGNTRLGASSGTVTQVGGDLQVTGGLDVLGAGGKVASFDTPIVFTNGARKGPFQLTTADTLDPSLIECTRKYFARPGYRHHCLNDAQRTPLYEGTQAYVTDPNILVDTGALRPFYTEFPSGTYYNGKIEEGEFEAIVLSGDQEGERVPVQSYDGSLRQWTLTRPLDGALEVGDRFLVYHPQNSAPAFMVAEVGLSVRIRASAVWEMIGNARGIWKKRTSDYVISGLPSSEIIYIYMSTEPGVNGIEEDPPTFSYSLDRIESDQKILIGQVETDVTNVIDVVCYSINCAFDSLWVKFNTAADVEVRQAGATWTLPFKPGLNKRCKDIQFTVLVTANSGNQPNLNTVKQAPIDSAGYYPYLVTDDEVTFVTPATNPYLGLSLPYWVRIVAR